MIVEPDKRQAYLSRQTHRWTLTVGSLNPQPANFTENSASVAFAQDFFESLPDAVPCRLKGDSDLFARHRRLGKRLFPIGVNLAH